MVHERVRRKISRAEIFQLIYLIQKQPWLSESEAALLDLFEYCQNPDQQALIAGLISRTVYVNEVGFGKSIKAICNQIETVWALQPAKTWFVSSNSKKNTDSSQEVLNRLKSNRWSSTGWNRRQFFTRYREVVDVVKKGDTVLIVDDFIGTGRSISKTIDWFRKKSNESDLEIDIRVCATAGCDRGIAALVATGSPVYSVHNVPQAITSYYTGTDLNAALDQMSSLEDLLEADAGQADFASFRMGYGKSEAMYFRDGGNTPNNVFPVFWWRNTSSGQRLTVMHRT